MSLKIIAYAPARHAVSCATLDPSPSRCDCGAHQTPLVSLYQAQAEIQSVRDALNAEIENVRKLVKS